MNKALLPILSRLTALQTPAEVRPGGVRVLADPGHPNPMAALLRELNETILARALRLDCGDGSSLTLDVAGRRVLRVTAASGIVGADACLAAGTLEDEHKDDLLQVLQAVAAPRQELRVTSRPLPPVGDGLSIGLPVALLADLMLIDLNHMPQRRQPAPAAEPVAAATAAAPVVALRSQPRAFDLRGLAVTVGPALVAWVIKGGEHDGTSGGAEEMLSPLRSFLEDEAEAIQAQLERAATRPGGPICVVLGATLIDGHSVICAGSGNGLMLGVIEGDATQRLLQAWAQARG